ncbi:hypothetical protein Q5752_001004 [Cryptotrichosporon argae]
MADVPRSPYRASTVESADDAAGIFDLYGRDSWVSSASTAVPTPRASLLVPAVHAVVGPHKQVRANGARGVDASGLATRGGETHVNGNGNGHARRDGGAEEELRSPLPSSPGSELSSSWEGPMESLTLARSVSGERDPDPEPEPDGRQPPTAPLSRHGSARGADGAALGSRRASAGAPPAVTVTPSRPAAIETPPHASPAGSRRHTGQAQGQGQGQHDGSVPASTNSSAASSPAHPAASRLSPRPSGGAASASQVSIAASSQYPGEDADAFHVRSTYARLDVEGVYGDGWDEGVERTRGGTALSAARKTVMLPARAGELPERELAFRARLDRYGFVDEPLRNRSESRLALVPAAPFHTVPKLPAVSPLAGRPAVVAPPGAGGVDGPSARQPTGREGQDDARTTREEGRVGKWLSMMAVRRRDEGGNAREWKWRDEERAKVGRRVWKGIPDRWRMAAWATLAEDRAAGKGKQKSAEHIADEYKMRVDLPSTSDVQIDLDVPRTISGHVLFQTRFGHGQRALFHVLHAFSQVCETCGYCQGMGSVAATLLCYFDPERAYTLLVRIHDIYDMHGLFAPGFPGLLETFYVQERLIEHLMPDVYRSFQRNMISSSAWGAKIYITLFVNTVPFHVQLRLWDAMFLDGYDVMVFATVAIVWAFRDLLAAPTANFESILSLLSSFYVVEDEDRMLRWMRKLLWAKSTRARVAAWRDEWRALVRDGKSEAALL